MNLTAKEVFRLDKENNKNLNNRSGSSVIAGLSVVISTLKPTDDRF